jgi:thymidylate synthase
VSTLELPDLRAGYVQLASWVVDHGLPFTSRGLSTLELTGVTLEFPDPTGVMLPLGVNRKVNTRLAAVETLQLLSGNGDPSLLLRAAPSYADVLVHPENLTYGSYGLRLRYQWDALIGLLRREPDTRRAVLTIWREDDLTHDGDRPCTLTLQFLVRDDKLELIVNMRSQDLYRGVPYDLFMFTQAQLSLAAQLGLGVGRYTHHVGSLHVYASDLEAVGMLTTPLTGMPAGEYPRGILSVTPDVTYCTEVAQFLIEGGCDEFELELNAWYVRRLAALPPRAEVAR